MLRKWLPVVGLFFILTGCRQPVESIMPGASYSGNLPPLTSEEQVLAGRLRDHVDQLASKIGERHAWRKEALEKAVQYIEDTFSKLGYIPERQSYSLKDQPFHNIESVIVGSSAPEEIVIIGAHYDSIPDCPAANDNASGVAALLEMARLQKDRQPARSLRFVAFANEEPPFFQTSDMGSLVYARRCRKNGDNILGMMALETIGYYSDRSGSQQYPPGMKGVFPDTGNFISFVANHRSRELVQCCLENFRSHTQFPSEGTVAPEDITGIGWSDHWSFWQCGYPALMVTDTAPFRYPWYHSPQDTPEKIDYEKMARIVAGLARMVESLTK